MVVQRWFKDFDESNFQGEEIEDFLKNYDVALSLAVAGRMKEAYSVMESEEIDLEKELDPGDFQDFDFNPKEIAEKYS
ncbi:hypothetical protein AKJ64_05210 [candidate division MSBL1 archaeon SCGC-AAA259E17]|uniref:Uncharacterized protein n=1 Tax=candidate division MSBL1 archaeon SCGC-AAA259E17 TaxID=1698263 RepID=A0A133U9F0_9EURY|nr:hypothetical protein AKJ64_05210 [candidate division MSBL1 archaeon SCGC-AAA259E17]